MARRAAIERGDLIDCDEGVVGQVRQRRQAGRWGGECGETFRHHGVLDV
jgi:hypothetical protein